MLKAVLFDLDNTLYDPGSDLFSLIDVRINRYMCDVAGIAHDEVDGLRRRYWREYGVTLQGLIRHHAVDPEDYLEYVHDVDVTTRIGPQPALLDALMTLRLRRVVFTNGSRAHAERVLDALGLSAVFEEIFDVRVAGYLPKPRMEPYLEVLRRMDCAAQDCVMVEDSLENLRTAKGLGMRTVLVAKSSGEARAAFVDALIDHPGEVTALIDGWMA